MTMPSYFSELASVEVRLAEPVDLFFSVLNNSEAFTTYLQSRAAFRWCYLTAHNPNGEQLDAVINEGRNCQVVEHVRRLGYEALVRGEIGCPAWLPEGGILILGIAELAARQLGLDLGQNSILVGKCGEPSKLLYNYQQGNTCRWATECIMHGETGFDFDFRPAEYQAPNTTEDGALRLIAPITCHGTLGESVDIIAVKCPPRIKYFADDETGFDIELTPAASEHPLTLGALRSLIDTAHVSGEDPDAGLVIGVVRKLRGEGIQVEVLSEFVSVESKYYPQLAVYYASRLEDELSNK